LLTESRFAAAFFIDVLETACPDRRDAKPPPGLAPVSASYAVT